MPESIAIPSEVVTRSFGDACRAPKPRGNFFHELRKAFKNNLADAFLAAGIQAFPKGTLSAAHYLREGIVLEMQPITKKGRGYEEDSVIDLDLVFCARYGHDDYSLYAINYLDKAYSHIPSPFPFRKVPHFSIGNILLLVENGDYDVNLDLGNGLRAVGYSYEISKRKRKSYVCLFGVHFDKYLLPPSIKAESCPHDTKDLDEWQIGPIQYPTMWICRQCGQLITCECFDGYYSVQSDLVRWLPYGDSEPVLTSFVESIISKPRICHLCNDRVPSVDYGNAMYYSAFMQKYLPYYTLWCRKEEGRHLSETDYKQIENDLRESLGYPRIGNLGVSETVLFKIVEDVVTPRQVIRRYRGKELCGLEIDIWIPSLRLGIEYQGVQHYEVVEHWGSEEGLEKRIRNDARKRSLSKELGYGFIEFSHDDCLTEENVRRKLAKYLP